MASGHEHLVISPLDGGHLVFGPIVEPGKTPCTRCRDITMGQALGGVSAVADKVSLSTQADIQQPPVFAAHYLAGVIASFILAHIDQGRSQLTGGYMAIDTLNLSQSSLIALGRNPECGCHWL
jgi:bacteriocin biosynthesis cyclodehydratase domain-containing protein